MIRMHTLNGALHIDTGTILSIANEGYCNKIDTGTIL